MDHLGQTNQTQRIRLQNIILILVTLAGLENAYAQSQPKRKEIPPPLAPKEYAYKGKRMVPRKGEHPRVFVTADKVESLQRKFNNPSPQTAELKKLLLKQANRAIDGTATDGKPNKKINQTYEANAFLYLINGDKKRGKKAVSQVLNYFRSLKNEGNHKKATNSRLTMRGVQGAGMVYDWCFDLFKPSERQELIKEVHRAAANAEFKWPYYPSQTSLSKFISNHWAEGMHPQLMAFGIACYDEDPSIYTLCAEHLYDYFVPLRNIKNAGHKFEQGTGYAGRFKNDLMTTLLIMGMGGENPYTSDQGQVPYYPVYNRRPDGRFMAEGDFGYPWIRSVEMWMSAASIYQDPVLQGQLHDCWDILIKDDKSSAAALFCQYDDQLKATPVEQLPLTRYFPGPAGNMISRTAWDIDGDNPKTNSPAVIVKMDVNEYNYSGHVHADAGHFSIYYKGGLALDAGAYAEDEKGKKFGGIHFQNYLIKTIAHNSLLIYDPNADMGWGVNSGGQVSMQGWFTYEEMETIARRATVLAHDFGPDKMNPEYSCLSGDLTRGYRAARPFDGSYPNKAEEVKRSFVFLNHFDDKIPATLIVFDRVTSRKPEFKKTWLLHSEEEPVIRSNIQTIPGKSGQSTLVNTTILPGMADATFAKIGGPGREFEVLGVNYPVQDPAQIDRLEAGRWRIELSPKTGKKTDLFLNVLQVIDGVGKHDPMKVEKIKADGFVGVSIADRMVLFPEGPSKNGDAFTLGAPGGVKKAKLLVTGLAAGDWLVKQGNDQQKFTVTEEAGTLYLDVLSKQVIIEPVK